MFTIYVCVLDTLADWEQWYVISELNSGRFFKKGESRVSLKTVSYSQEPINEPKHFFALMQTLPYSNEN